MKFSKKGYLRNSPDVNKPQNIIQGGNITMKGVDFKVHGVDNNGYARVMTPGYDHYFPHAKYVTETPIKNKEMNGPFKMKPGRGNMPKTGKGLPKDMTNPIMQTTDPRSGFVTPNIDPKSGFERYQKRKVSRDVVRKRDIMDSDVGKDAFKKVLKKAEGLSGFDISPKRVAGTFKTQLPTAGEAKADYGDPFSDVVKTYDYGQTQGFKSGGRAEQALGKMGAKVYEAKYGKGSL